MAELSMIRVDARLVHGQVAAQWIKILGVNRVCIVEDEVANDPFMVEVFRLAAPAGTAIECYTLEQGVDQWINNNKFGDGKIILLFKYPETAYKAYNMGMDFKELNVAQIPGGHGRKLVYATVSMSPEQADLLEDLHNRGVDVYIQQVAQDKRMPIMNVIDKARK